MIEVEKKFILNQGDEKRLIEGAEFVSEKIMEDTYFDTMDFSLTTNDKWLRCRNDRWELKLPMIRERASQRRADQYQELETEGEIRQELSIDNHESFKDDLASAGYAPFCMIKTTRRKYKTGDFIIDLDIMDFGYELAEIELMIQNQSDMETAIQKIQAFAVQHGLTNAPVRGKVIEYLKRFSPAHYQALVESRVV